MNTLTWTRTWMNLLTSCVESKLKRKTPEIVNRMCSVKEPFNFIKKETHSSFPVNFAKFLRIPFYR